MRHVIALFVATAVFVCLTWEAGAVRPRLEVVGQNLVVNGGFEEGGEGWSSAPQVLDEGAYEGEHCGLIDSTADGEAKEVIQDFVPLKPFTYYEFSMAARRETGQGYVRVICNWYAAPGERLMSSPQWPAGRAIPVTLRTGEAMGDWREYSGVFRSNRADLGGVQLMIFIGVGADRVYLDDISIREVRYPDAPEWELPDAVVFEGRPSRFGMAVEDAAQDGQTFTVTTSGATYVLDAAAGTMSCHQRIGAEREVVTADFGGPLGDLAIVHRDEEVCVLEGDDLAIGFQGDSLVTIATNRALDATLTSAIGAEWFRAQEPYLLAIDQQGGFCVMPWSRPELHSGGTTMSGPNQDTGEPGWTASWQVGAREMFALAVFPGREFDWEESFEKRIVNTGAEPKPDALREYAQHASVLFMFNGIYNRIAGVSYAAPYNVGAPDKLQATIDLAHELGMEAIVYRHPSSYDWLKLSLDYFLEDLRVTRGRYGFDGWYLDGYPAWNSWFDCYRAMRIVRDRVGDGTIYVHCTLNPPARMTQLYCPFIDSYATFLLRGEGQFINGLSDPYLRYVVGTQNISNTIATLKAGDMVVEPLPEDYTQQDLEQAERASLRLQLQTMLSLNGRCRWAYPESTDPARSHLKEVYLGYYFAELDRMEQQWRATGEPIPMTWPPQGEDK